MEGWGKWNRKPIFCNDFLLTGRMNVHEHECMNFKLGVFQVLEYLSLPS